jgi:hypothetical protein
LAATSRIQFPCGGIRDDFARITAAGQRGPEEVGKSKRLRSRDFGDAVHWGADRGDSDTFRDVGSGHRLKVGGWHTHRVADGRGVGERIEELEELRRVDDGVGNGAVADQLLL